MVPILSGRVIKVSITSTTGRMSAVFLYPAPKRPNLDQTDTVGRLAPFHSLFVA